MPPSRRSAAAVGVLAVVLAAMPLVIGDPYLLHAATLFLLYATLAMGLSVVVAYAGLLDLGYVAFFAVGAYFYAIANKQLGLPFVVALPIGAGLSAVAGILLGLPTLRVRGDYLALVTLAFGEMVRQILENWTVFTNGPQGISAIDGPGLIFMSAAVPWRYYTIGLVWAASAAWLMVRIRRSPVSRIWESIRDEETAARSAGINSTRWLLLAFAIGTAFAGVVGVMFAAIQRFVSPETFVLDESVLVLSIVVLAGGKSLVRILLATAILFGMPELLRGLAQYRALLFGCLLVGFTILDHKIGRRATQRRRVKSEREAAHITGGDRVPDYPDLLRFVGPAIGAIGVTALRKEFSGLKALDGTSFSICPPWSIVAIVGPNGAGKTTFFNVLSGLLACDSGSITIEGIGDVAAMPSHVVARCGIARTFQRPRLFGELTVFENVEIGSMCGRHMSVARVLISERAHLRYDSRSQAIASAAMCFVGIESMASLRVDALPMGMQRRVEIARALAQRPRLLLLDEVAAGLNEKEKSELIRLIQVIARQGDVRIMLVEHDMPFVAALAERAIVLDSGRLIADGPPAVVLRDERVIESYLGSGGVAAC